MYLSLIINQYLIPHRIIKISSRKIKMIFNDVQKEFIAKLVADIGKTIFAVGLASYIFEKFPMYVRIGLFVACIVLLVWSVFIHPKHR